VSFAFSFMFLNVLYPATHEQAAARRHRHRLDRSSEHKLSREQIPGPGACCAAKLIYRRATSRCGRTLLPTCGWSVASWGGSESVRIPSKGHPACSWPCVSYSLGRSRIGQLPRRRRRVEEPPCFHRVAIKPTGSRTGLFCGRPVSLSWCTSEAVATCVEGAPEGHWQSVTGQ